MPLRDNAGKTLAFAVWRDIRSGDVASHSASWAAIAAIAFLAVCIAWLLFITWRSAGRLKQQQKEQARLLQMIDGMPLAVMTVEPETWRISYANDMATQLFKSIGHLLPFNADALFGAPVGPLYRHLGINGGRLSDPACLPYNARLPLGPEVLDLNASAITDDDGRYLGTMLSWAIVTKEVEAENRIWQLAKYDPLTGLANRVTFSEALSASLDDLTDGIGLLYIDLDGFKQVNDTKGHLVGDKLLEQVAARLRKVCHEDGMTIARLGGDEFAVLVPHANLDGLKQRADELIAALSETYCLDAHYQAQVGASVGIALGPEHGATSETLQTRVDIALYAAKAAGKGTSRVFSPDMEEHLQEQHFLLTALRDALQTEQRLFVFYQPIVDVSANRVTAREALLRWHHPERGWIPPAEFIPVAEQSSLIHALGAFVLNTACRDAAGWEDDARVAVNISAAQLGKVAFVDEVARALAESGLAPNRLEIEVTETAMLNEEQGSIEALRRVHDMGVRVALDDFGTGYSSLTHLRMFPFDKIKIDGAFVKDAVDHPESASVVRAIVDLGQRLGVTTVAECVETEVHLAQVLKEGCTEVQGFVYGRPIPNERDAAKVAALNQRCAAAAAGNNP